MSRKWILYSPDSLHWSHIRKFDICNNVHQKSSGSLHMHLKCTELVIFGCSNHLKCIKWWNLYKKVTLKIMKITKFLMVNFNSCSQMLCCFLYINTSNINDACMFIQAMNGVNASMVCIITTPQSRGPQETNRRSTWCSGCGQDACSGFSTFSEWGPERKLK